MKYPSSELALNNKGQVYHLAVSPENVSDKIILVGDQDRVDLIASFFDDTEFTSRHREFVCTTGTFKGKRLTVLSTGIGTDNIDIVVNELDAIFNIDLEKRTDKEEKKSLTLVRIGTCGILQPDIPVHSYILSEYAFGFDNVAHFYPIDFSDDERKVGEILSSHLELPETIVPYCTTANEELVKSLESDKTYSGITVTSSGFYAPQGRSLRLGLVKNDINERLTSFNDGKLKVVNFEMESSALFSLGKALGHRCATICLGVANRPNNDFSKGYNSEMKELIQYVLERI